MALAVTIGVVSLIAILAVATLSLGGRMVQSASLGIRDARLDGAAAFGLAAALDQWRDRDVGQLAIGGTLTFPATVPGVPVAVTVTTTRVAQELFWIVADANAEGGATRRENLVVRLRVPDAGQLLEADSTDVTTLGFLLVDSLAAHADAVVPAGTTISGILDGVIHVTGDATIANATGEGVLIVEGHLAITGSLTYAGVILVRDGLSSTAASVTVFGLIRAAGDPALAGPVHLTKSGPAVQTVMAASVTPRPVSGRRWAEMH